MGAPMMINVAGHWMASEDGGMHASQDEKLVSDAEVMDSVAAFQAKADRYQRAADALRRLLKLHMLAAPKVEMWSQGRPVIHFLSTLTEAEMGKIPSGMDRVGKLYDMALDKVKPFGGKKFHNSRFGGGIVFETEQQISRFLTEGNL